jgi:hypothetical protein
MEETQVLWDWCSCCSQKTNGFFAIMYALVGWRCKGTIATVSTYFGYWLFVLSGIAIFFWWKKKKAAQGVNVGVALGGIPTSGVEALAVSEADIAAAKRAAEEERLKALDPNVAALQAEEEARLDSRVEMSAAQVVPDVENEKTGL